MRYQRITVENFLVFRGEQTIAIPDQAGTVVVYGRNGKGKTSLLNAVRWAWTGSARSRGTRVVPKDRLTNQHAVDDAAGAEVRCRVRLEFTADGCEWDLTRSLTTRGTGSPSMELTILRDGTALSAADAVRQVAELMPPDIEQFFLFDGELLDQYEKLVDEDSSAGSTLREAIERILGMPVLTNAMRDSRHVAEQFSRLVAEAAQRDTHTKRLGDALAAAQTISQQHRENRDREDDNIRRYEKELSECERQITEQKDKLELKARRDDLASRVLKLQAELEEAGGEFREALNFGWKAVLVEPVEKLIATRELELEALEPKLLASRFAAALAERWEATDKSACPVCRTGLDADAKAALHEHLDSTGTDNLSTLEDDFGSLRHKVKVLRSLVAHEERAEIKAIESRYRRIRVDLDDAKADLEEKNEQLLTVEGEELEKVVKRHGDLKLLLERAREAYAIEDESYRAAKGREDGLEDQIRKQASGQVDPSVRARQEAAAGLAALFERAIVVYRERMRDNVQDKASDIFRAMASEPDFVKLVINESYGLRILDKNARQVQGRSAGYEHLVALSLLGALQQCSPISGAIIMDSPFGRLDDEHVHQVVANLSELSSQVFLLVHEGELARDEARKLLRTQLLAEYELERVDAHETKIREVRR